jgi:hypothetical protein
VITDPPFPGAVHDSPTEALPDVVVKPVGTAGVVDGVTEFDAELDADIPIAFVAVTVNVYAVPFVSPVTVIGEPVLELAILPGLEVTV